MIEAIAITVGYVGLAVASLVLAAIDVRTRRLPNVIVYPSTAGFLLCLVIATASRSEHSGAVGWLTAMADPEALVRALVSAVALAAFYWVLWLLGGMGLGDVKLAVLLGAALGWIGWESVVIGTVAAFILGGLVGVALLIARRARRGSKIPFGPWMLLGAWIGIGAAMV